MLSNPQFSAEILNGKLDFLCSDGTQITIEKKIIFL